MEIQNTFYCNKNNYCLAMSFISNYSLTEMIFLDSRTNHVTFFFLSWQGDSFCMHVETRYRVCDYLFIRIAVCKLHTPLSIIFINSWWVHLKSPPKNYCKGKRRNEVVNSNNSFPLSQNARGGKALMYFNTKASGTPQISFKLSSLVIDTSKLATTIYSSSAHPNQAQFGSRLSHLPL